MKRGSGDPIDRVINHLAGNMENIVVSQSEFSLPTYCAIKRLKKYKARTEERRVVKSKE